MGYTIVIQDQHILKRASTNELFIADPGIALNGPAHLKATMLGASQTFVIEEEK